MNEHINKEGKFQSDKYIDWCIPDIMPLKFTDLMAQPFIWDYGEERRSVDPVFTEGVHQRLRGLGYCPGVEKRAKGFYQSQIDQPNNIDKLLESIDWTIDGMSECIFEDGKYPNSSLSEVAKDLQLAADTITTQQKKIEELKKERDIWKSQLEYIKDKHLELHQQEIEHEKRGEEYTGQRFDNSVICVWEVAVVEADSLQAIENFEKDLE